MRQRRLNLSGCISPFFIAVLIGVESHAQTNQDIESIKKTIEAIRLTDKVQNQNYVTYSDSILNSLYNEYDLRTAEKNTYRRAELLGKIGEIEINIGNPHSAIKHFYQMLELSRTLKNQRLIANAYNKIGIVQTMYQNYDDAIRNYTNAIELYKDLDEKNKLSGAINNLGVLYKNQSKLDIALNYFEEFLGINKKVKNYKGIAVGLCNIGEIFYLKKEFSTSLHYYRESLVFDSLISNEFSFSNTFNKIATVLIAQKNYSAAKETSWKALRLAQKYNNMEEISISCYNLSVIYESEKNDATALEMFKIHAALNDEITNLEGQTEVLREKFKFEYEQKRNQENIKAVERESQQKLRYQRNIFILVVVFSLAMLIVFIKYRNKINEKKNLLNEIKLLKSEYAVKNAMKNSLLNELKLDQFIIDKLTENRLNETDWKILETLYDSPAISNKELSDKICLSYEGTRSSLKKMYRLFDIGTSKNQRFELISRVIKLSTESSKTL